MKSRYVVRTNRPAMGLVAFARAVAMGSLGTCSAAMHVVSPSGHSQLDRNEESLHPGEESA